MAAWRPWSISGGAMDGAAMDSASERGCECESGYDINMQHMKGHTVKWQKFVFLAAAGEIVYKLNKSDHDQVSTQAIRCWL